MKLAPIALFVYNRPEHTRQTIDALMKNKLAEKSELFIFSDAPRNQDEISKVMEVRKYLRTIQGFKRVSIVEAEVNLGLANSIIAGVSNVLNKYEKIIVMEDDLVSSVNYLIFMNKALDVYEINKSIWAISGYNVPIIIPDNYKQEVYLSLRASSWGWATWNDRWDKCDWEIQDFNNLLNSRKKQILFNKGGHDLFHMLKSQMAGEIDSWAIRWTYNQFKNNCYSIYPVVSKIQNIGTDGSGIHCGVTSINKTILDDRKDVGELTPELDLNKLLLKRFQKHFNPRSFKGKIFYFLDITGLYGIIKSLVK